MNTGGPAFPGTLLDWFAGQALTGILADSESQGEPEDFSAAAYNIAESMLAEKARREAVVKESSTTDHSPDAGKMVELEKRNRELVERINQLESVVNDPHALWANWLRGTVKLPEAIGDVRQYKERIKRLKKAGDEVVYWFSPMAKHQLTPLHLAALNQWNAAKETKP